MKCRLVIGIAGVVAAAASAVSCSHDSPTEGTGTDPAVLTGLSPHGWATRLDVGTRFTNGFPVVFNKSGHEVTLIDVRPIMRGDGLAFLGARVAGMDRKTGNVERLPGFPPSDPMLGDTVKAKGLVLPPGRDASKRGFELLLGFEVTGSGRSVMRALEISYAVDGEPKTTRLVSTMAICAPQSGDACAQEYPNDLN